MTVHRALKMILKALRRHAKKSGIADELGPKIDAILLITKRRVNIEEWERRVEEVVTGDWPESDDPAGIYDKVFDAILDFVGHNMFVGFDLKGTLDCYQRIRTLFSELGISIPPGERLRLSGEC